MKVVLFHKAWSAVGDYRIWIPGQALAKHAGWDIKLWPRWATYERVLAGHGKLWDLRAELEKADLAVYQWFGSEGEQHALTAWRGQCAIPSIMDLDDDVFNILPGHGAFDAYQPKKPEDCLEIIPIPPEAIRCFLARGWAIERKPDGTPVAIRQKDADFPSVFKATLEHLNGLTVSTPFLAESYRGHVPEQWPVVALPNCYDPDTWAGIADAPPLRRPDPTIVWSGSMAHAKNIKAILPALKKVLAALPAAKLVILGADLEPFKSLPATQVEFVPWVSLEVYPAALHALGGWVGIAPAINHPFNNAKSHIRWMEYTLAGLPTIASPRPEYLKWADDGAWYADDVETWTGHLLELLGDATLREKLLAVARERVQACQIERNIDAWVTAYAQAIRQGVLQMYPLPAHLQGA